MLDVLLGKYASQCGIREILNREALLQVRKTALPWTTVPYSLCLAMNRAYLQHAINNDCIAAIIVSPVLFPFCKNLPYGGKGVVVADYAEELFYLVHMEKIHRLHGLRDSFVSRDIADTAFVHPTAVLGDSVHLGENVFIGAYTVIGDNTVIDDDSWIGPQCLIGEGAFFPKSLFGEKMHIPHLGGVIVGKKCRLYGQNYITASSYFEECTVLDDAVFLGFQTGIGHDAVLEKDVSISSMALVAGRTRIGAGTWVGAGVTLSSAITVGAKASVKIGAVVIDDVPAGEAVSGNFAIPHQKNLLRKLRSSR